jgi:xylan 1,4-beta-xylosidase
VVRSGDLNSTGFDPSLFHDDDGRKYLVNMMWDYQPGHNRFAGIALREYSTQERKLIGPEHRIFEGTAIGFTEGPHLYKRGGYYYYLLTAEGGTGYGHTVTMARSRNLTGPYELHPDTYVLTSRHRPDIELQRAGHADLVETQNGEIYMVHLCGRPIRNRGRCILGRETAIQPMVWSADGWLRTADGLGLPYSEAPAPALPAHAFSRLPVREDFDTPELPLDFQWLRSPWPEELFSLTARSGHLRLFGRETLGSMFHQALVARRQQSHCYSAATVIEFEPERFQQAAGLICYYNGSKFHYLYISHDAAIGKYIRVMSCLPDQVQSEVFSDPFAIPGGVPVHLRVEVDFERLYFAYRLGGQEWQRLPGHLDASILSDEAAAPGTPNFTGAFVGMCCQDMAGTRRHADFDYFVYEERGYLADPFSEES